MEHSPTAADSAEANARNALRRVERLEDQVKRLMERVIALEKVVSNG